MSRKSLIRGRKTFGYLAQMKQRSFGRSEVYHLITPFCQTRTRSRILNSTVMMVEKKAAIMISAAKTLPYSAHPCAQLTYQPRPDLTPTVSATTRVKNEAPNPMK